MAGPLEETNNVVNMQTTMSKIATRNATMTTLDQDLLRLRQALRIYTDQKNMAVTSQATTSTVDDLTIVGGSSA